MSYRPKEKLDYVWVQKAMVLAFADAISILISYMVALLLRFDFMFSSIPRNIWKDTSGLCHFG